MIGKIICEFVPNASNKRNSEGSFIKLNNGDILFIYTRYRASGFSDECTADLYGVVSKDEGETFGEPFEVLNCDKLGADNIMSVSLMRMKNGSIAMFYLRKFNSVFACIPYVAFSYDEGKTFTEHVRCIPEDGYYVLNNDRVIMLENGRLLMPVSRHGRQGDVFTCGIVFMYASDDEGKTWYQISDEIKLPNNIRRNRGKINHWEFFNSCMEPGVVQLKDGTVWCFIRTARGRQYETFSDDFGKTWEEVQPSPFSSPSAPLCVKKLRNDKLFAAWSPIPEYTGREIFDEGAWGRNPYVFTILNENADIVTAIRNIETDKYRGFCYCAIYETEKGDILLGYCAGDKKDGCCLSRLRVRKIYKNEFEDMISK